MAWSGFKCVFLRWIQGFKRPAYLIVVIALAPSAYSQTSSTGSLPIGGFKPNTKSRANYKPAPKRVNQEDIQRMLNSKRPHSLPPFVFSLWGQNLSY